MSVLQFLKTLVKNALFLKFFSVFIFKASTILFIKHANVGWHMTQMLKCMLENDVFVNVKPKKINN